jgi:hypothetical protein
MSAVQPQLEKLRRRQEVTNYPRIHKPFELEYADIIRLGNPALNISSTAPATLPALTSVVGWVGVLLNNSSFVSV